MQERRVRRLCLAQVRREKHPSPASWHVGTAGTLTAASGPPSWKPRQSPALRALCVSSHFPVDPVCSQASPPGPSAGQGGSRVEEQEAPPALEKLKTSVRAACTL